MVLNAIHIDYSHNISQDLTSKLQSSLPRCLLNTSTCMPGRHLKHAMSKPESLIAPPSQLHTQLCPFQVMTTLSFYLLRPKALMSCLALPFHSYSTSSLSWEVVGSTFKSTPRTWPLLTACMAVGLSVCWPFATALVISRALSSSTSTPDPKFSSKQPVLPFKNVRWWYHPLKPCPGSVFLSE